MGQMIGSNSLSGDHNVRGSNASHHIGSRDTLYGLISGVGFFALATLSLTLSKFDSTLASVWLPNAAAVAFILRARLSNEVPAFLSIFISGILANYLAGTPFNLALLYSTANLIDIAAVTWLMRRKCNGAVDMTNLSHLAHFIWIGGLVGPGLSAALAALGMGSDLATMSAGAMAWFLTDSMGMIIVVPTALLFIDALQSPIRPSAAELFEKCIVLTVGMATAFLVFQQNASPLLFLIPPVTLLHAFRLGSLGTAFYITVVAIVSSVMTFAGYGPIHEAATTPNSQLHLIQAFIAANFLTGLPVTAILAGRDRILAELAAGKKQLDLLADNITDAVLRYDLSGVCTYASPSTQIVLGEQPENCIGEGLVDRMREDTRERIEEVQERLISGTSDKERVTYRRLLDSPDGKPVYIEAECALASHAQTGEPEGIIVSARDVTERVELELLLTRARIHAENTASAKSEFLARMSHEIRTPMNGVLGFAELMMQSDLNDDQRRQVELIVHSGRSMMMLLNDILDLSKIEAGQISIDQTAVNLHETLNECVNLHLANAKGKGIELVFEGDNSKDTDNPDVSGEHWINTDSLRVRQIVLNLISNAIKFTDTGSVEVSYSVKPDHFRVSVKDTGIGIGPTRHEAIFSPFAQAEGNITHRFGGTGLGLTISRQLAELLGGELSVKSKVGSGSCFTLTLPTSPADPVPAEPSHDIPVSLRNLPRDACILLVEDHDINRMLAIEMLERCGQSVATAHDGNEAISMVIDSMIRGTPFDLVLMDIQMPCCDGYAATRAIRAEGIGPNTLPIIALTANAFPEDIAAMRDAGMQGHLPKPLVFADLAKVLQRWLPTRIVESTNGDTDALGSIYEPSAVAIAPVKADPAPKTAPSSRVPQNLFKTPKPELAELWKQRRHKAITAVRQSLDQGVLQCEHSNAAAISELAQIIHKLAGSAAMFGEPELGDHAIAFEHALRSNASADVITALAQELLELAGETLPE